MFQGLVGMKQVRGKIGDNGSWRARGCLRSQVEARFSLPWLPIPNQLDELWKDGCCAPSAWLHCLLLLQGKSDGEMGKEPRSGRP